MNESVKSVSILICTRNHLGPLRQTVKSVAALHVPDSLTAELIIIDNGSTDGTSEWASSLMLPNMPVRLVTEPEPGQARARNAGMAAARGDIILFTDDDVVLPSQWIEKMTGPLRTGRADAVRGKSQLAPTLQRPWMEGFHRAVLAVTEGIDEGGRSDLVGLSMGFSRSVLDRVPAFDPELGPGTPSGYLDDTLFSYQLLQAGFRIESVTEAPVQHEPDLTRLTRAGFLQAARCRGRALTYVAYHWEHAGEERWTRRRSGLEFWRHPLLVCWKRRLNLAWWRVTHPKQIVRQEGIAFGEFQRVNQLAQISSYLSLRHGPRNYEMRGLVKRNTRLAGVMPEVPQRERNSRPEMPHREPAQG